MNTGRCPEPPPVAMATLPGTGASARTTARGEGRRSWPGCAARMPSSISSTNGSGSLRIFCITAIAPPPPRWRSLLEREGLDDLLLLRNRGATDLDELDEDRSRGIG